MISPPFLIHFSNISCIFPVTGSCLWLCSLGAILAAWSALWLSSIWTQITPHGSAYARPPLLCYAMLCYALCPCTGGSTCIYRSIGLGWRNGAPQLLILCPNRASNKFSDDIDIHMLTNLKCALWCPVHDKIGPQLGHICKSR